MNKSGASHKHSRLQVFLNQGIGSPQICIGECYWIASESRAAFEWSQAAISSGLALSPLKMPYAPRLHRADYQPFSGIHPLFSDSIPDGFGLRLMNKGLQVAGYALEEINPLHRLAWIGERGVGALTYAPAIDADVDPALIDVAEAATLAADAEAENFKDIPKEAIRAGGSALGMRPKFWASIDFSNSKVVLGDTLKVPHGFTPCLLKFAPSKGDKNEPFFEATCLELAAKYGVRAARAQVLPHKSGAALAVERFDRNLSGIRIHTQSVAALVGVDFRSSCLDYSQLAKLAQEIGEPSDVERLYRQLCFNVALSIRDDHVKNFAFCMDAAGQWSLSPAFDLCPSIGLGYTQEHTTTINGKGKDISSGDLEKFGRSIGLTTKIVQEGIDNARAAAAEFESLAVRHGAAKIKAREWAKSFKTIDAFLAAPMIQGSNLTSRDEISPVPSKARRKFP
jgi:serine/threonine-protein kinase HipA